MKKYIIFAIVFILHMCIQFILWALHPGHLAVKISKYSEFIFNLLYSIFTFPVNIFSRFSFINNYFDLFFVMNSIIWSLVITKIILLKK